MHVLGKAKANPDKPKKAGPAKIPKPPSQPIPDALDAFEAMCNEEDPSRAIMLLFWKYRNQEQPFTMDVSAADLKAFEDCVKYLEVQPQIKVFRPQGQPAHPGAPATESRSAIPPRPAGKPKDYVVIQMVDQHGDAFVPIENNEADLQKSQEAQRVRRIRESAPQLAAQLMADLQANTTSSSTITEAAEALKLLARA